MCDNKFSEIRIDELPSKAFINYGPVILDEWYSRHKNSGKRRHQEGDERFDDREECRKINVKILEDENSKINSARIAIELLVKEILENFNISSTRKITMNRAYKKIVEELREEINELEKQLKENSENYVPLRKTPIPLCDVSGSMQGTPMYVCIALGIILSNGLQKNKFLKNRIISFEDDPQWIILKSDNFYENVMQLKSAPWGGSTNFEKAQLLFLDICIKNKISFSEIPDMVVFSDMQFNQANGFTDYSDYYRKYNYEKPVFNWDTHHEKIVKLWNNAKFPGELNPCYKEDEVPNIVYWDLRMENGGYPVDNNTKGTTLLSGFNPSLMKVILTGDDLNIEEEIIEENTGEVTKVVSRITPWDRFLKTMNDFRYQYVQDLITISNEKWMKIQ